MVGEGAVVTACGGLGGGRLSLQACITSLVHAMSRDDVRAGWRFFCESP